MMEPLPVSSDDIVDIYRPGRGPRTRNIQSQEGAPRTRNTQSQDGKPRTRNTQSQVIQTLPHTAVARPHTISEGTTPESLGLHGSNPRVAKASLQHQAGDVTLTRTESELSKRLSLLVEHKRKHASLGSTRDRNKCGAGTSRNDWSSPRTDTCGAGSALTGKPASGPTMITSDVMRVEARKVETVPLTTSDRSSCEACVVNLKTWYATACFTGTLFFLVANNTDFLPSIPTFVTGNILPVDHVHVGRESAVIVMLIFMWAGHFLRRFAEVLFLTDSRDYERWEIIWLNLTYPVFGFWIGWSCNCFTPYWVPKSYILVPGVLIFLTGEVGNCTCHFKSWGHQRRQTSDVDLVPEGCLFRFTPNPDLYFEMLTWIGFALTTSTLAAYMFVSVNIIYLTVYMLWLIRIKY